MLKLLIIDDEPIVREGLREIIPWSQLGFAICGEGVDGKDGLNKIMSLNPDLVLIDIKMSGMYGLDVIKAVRLQGFKGKFIILTGYSDFEYAKSAVSLGVSSYLLKPIEEDELISIAQKLYEETLRENNIQRHIDSSGKYIRNSILRSIILGNKDIDSTNVDIEKFDLNLSFNSYQVAILETTSEIENMDVSEEVLKVIRGLSNLSSNMELINIDNKIVLLIKGLKNDESVGLLERVYKRLSCRLNIRGFITLGRSVDCVNRIGTSYKDAKSLLERRFFFSKENIVSWDSVNEAAASYSKDTRIQDSSTYTEEIYTSIEVNDSGRIREIFRDMEMYFIQSNYSSEKIKGICINVFVELKDKVNANYDELKDIIVSNQDIIHNIYDKSSLAELLDYLSDELINISNRILNNSSDNVVKRILNYIQKNYYKDLKLETLAEIFNYNSAYLGKIFKASTGESFNTYLDKVRIDQAKILLCENDLKVYQVSEKVGYKNIDYFYGKFKKYVGVSPKEYKKTN